MSGGNAEPTSRHWRQGAHHFHAGRGRGKVDRFSREWVSNPAGAPEMTVGKNSTNRPRLPTHKIQEIVRTGSLSRFPLGGQPGGAEVPPARPSKTEVKVRVCRLCSPGRHYERGQDDPRGPARRNPDKKTANSLASRRVIAAAPGPGHSLGLPNTGLLCRTIAVESPRCRAVANTPPLAGRQSPSTRDDSAARHLISDAGTRRKGSVGSPAKASDQVLGRDSTLNRTHDRITP